MTFDTSFLVSEDLGNDRIRTSTLFWRAGSLSFAHQHKRHDLGGVTPLLLLPLLFLLLNLLHSLNMGNTASSCLCLRDDDVISQESLDPLVSSTPRGSKGQLHLMWKKGRPPPPIAQERFQECHIRQPTRLIVRKASENDVVTTHIYAVRKMEEQRPLLYEPDLIGEITEQPPQEQQLSHASVSPAELFTPAAMAPTPSMTST